MIDYIVNNSEQLLTMLISTIITISVVMQRTKINRKVKDMQKVTLEELTIEELENELERRKNEKETKVKRLIEPLIPKMKTPEELEEEERIKEEQEIKDHHNFIKDYLKIYREIKDSLNILKSYRHKYKYNEEVEKELKENE